MAKSVSDREDLLRDGVQMPVRGRAFIDGLEILCGFRSAGQTSLYCNQDPVYQFNDKHELRRVFFGGERYAAHSRQLHALNQSQVGSNEITQVKLKSTPARGATVNEIINEFHRIRNLILNRDIQWEFVGVDSAANFNLRVKDCLEHIGDPLTIAESPNV